MTTLYIQIINFCPRDVDPNADMIDPSEIYAFCLISRYNWCISVCFVCFRKEKIAVGGTGPGPFLTTPMYIYINFHN
jgi:hypothetical protein